MYKKDVAVYLKREAFMDIPVLKVFLHDQGFIRCASIDKGLHYLDILAVREEGHKVITAAISVPHALVSLILAVPVGVLRRSVS